MTTFYNLPFEFQDMTTFYAEQVNANFGALLSAVNSLQSQINSGSASGVQSLNGIRGALSLTSTGGTVNITPGSNTIDLEAVGAGTPGVFLSTMVAGGNAVTNTTNLQNDLNKVLAAGGGTLYIPYGTCNIAGSVYVGAPASGPAVFLPIRIIGVSNNSIINQTIGKDVFQVNTATAGSPLGGVVFQNFEISFSSGINAGAAIRSVNCQNLVIDMMRFIDCPVAVANDNGTQVSIFRCTGVYNNNTSPAGLAMITLGTTTGGGNTAIETYIAACTFRTTAINQGGVGGFGIACFSTEHVRLQNVRIEAFQEGFSARPTSGGVKAQKYHLDNVSCFTASNTTSTGAAFIFQPTAQTIWSVYMADCECTPGAASGTTYTGAGIVFDASQGTGSVIDQVRLVSCTSSNWNGPGLRLIGSVGTLGNVQVNGGAYICNAVTQTGVNGAGIYITTHATLTTLWGIYIEAAQLDNYSSQYTGTQLYAVAADGGTDGHIKVINCPMAGLVTAPILNSISASLQHFHVVGCRGYNDVGTPVAGLAQIPGNGVQFDGTTVGTSAYWGPILVIWSGGTVSNSKLSHDRSGISATLTGQTTGSFALNVGQSMELDYSGTPTAFTVIGQ